jgi:DNA-binding transcriptional ArsR family regulator
METTTDPRLRALAHPIRLRILAMVTATPVSATEVAETTGLAHSAASYHLRRLAEAGLVDPVGPESGPARPGRPKLRYRMRDDAFNDIGAEASQLLVRSALSEVARRLQAAGPRSRTSDAEVWLADEDAARVADILAEAASIVHERSLSPGAPASRHLGFTTLLLDLD